MRIPLTLLPDPTDARGLQAWVDVVADGESMRLLLDSGAGVTSLPSVGAIADLPEVGSGDGRGASGALGANPLVVVGELTFGDRIVTDLLVERAPRDWPHPGYLGLDVLQGIWHVDLSERVLELADNPPRSMVWHEHRGSRPTVPLRWATTEVNAIWDTGASLTVVDSTWAAAHPDAVRIGAEAEPGIDSTGAEVPSADGELLPATCAGHSIAAGPCVVVDLSGLNQHLQNPITMILGLPHMLGIQWWFDLAGERWGALRAT